ncbi:MAG: cytochrome c oxidase subunit II [Halobacteriota archaeon]
MSTTATHIIGAPLFQTGIVPEGTRVYVFQRIFEVFLLLGTLVGVVVISYMLYNAYKYRDGGGHVDDGIDRPILGEIPTGGGGGKKLFTSFLLSTIIVISLVAWTYGTLLFVEEGPPPGEDSITVDVEGYQFGWRFTYPNGHTEDTAGGGALRVPEDTAVRLNVTSADVFHNFGIPAQKVKSDAIPGEATRTWFIAEETGTYTAQCYELCGAGHSYMTADVVVMEPEAYDEWYANTSGSAS